MEGAGKPGYLIVALLVTMGVVPSRPAWQQTPNPFPDSAMPRYVPDPPGG